MSYHKLKTDQTRHALWSAFERDLLKREKITIDQRYPLLRTLAEYLLEGYLPKEDQIAEKMMAKLFPHTQREHLAKSYPTLVSDALKKFKKIRELPYPKALQVTPWWRDKQRVFWDFCTLLTNPIDLIAFAQCALLSGSDRRLIDRPQWTKNIIRQQRFHLNRAFQISRQQIDQEESPLSIESSRFLIGTKQDSNSFLNMLGYALGSADIVEKKDRLHHILEIGGGYGNLARLLKLRHPQTTITLVDLPESLLLCFIYLSVHFPDSKIALIDKTSDLDQQTKKSLDFILVPAQRSLILKNRHYDLAINTGSLQEMPKSSSHFFIDLITKKIDCDYFYSFNYFINARDHLPECESFYLPHTHEIIPQLDGSWKPLRFHLNPPHLTTDCRGRNWLELLAVKQKKRSKKDSKRRAKKLTKKAKRHPEMSDPWLSYLWHAIQIYPTRKALKMILNGLKQFTLKKNPKNHLFSGQFGAPSTPEANLEQRQILFERIEEVRYYRSLLTQIKHGE
ncbi:putative sugar O-methyltransferase [Magnetococcales bacterium HHB-1]